MPRVTIADLTQRLDAMQEELDELRAANAAPAVQLVREVTAPPSISVPIDFTQMAIDQGASYAYADTEWWGQSRYL